MRSREESSLKTDALRYLADALSEDVAATPEPKILAEERDDSAQRPPLALAFEELLANAKALARKRGTVPGISRADALSADTGTPLETMSREAPENFGGRAAPSPEHPEQAAENWGSWSRRTIPALLGRLTAGLQTRTALSAFATMLFVAILVPALYERFAEHPGGFSPSPGSPLAQREESPAPYSGPNPANVEGVPQLPRVSTLPTIPPDLRLRQPQSPPGTSETASAAPGAQQSVDPAVRRIASFLNSYERRRLLLARTAEDRRRRHPDRGLWGQPRQPCRLSYTVPSSDVYRVVTSRAFFIRSPRPRAAESMGVC
jgi:hypothetical protein